MRKAKGATSVLRCLGYARVSSLEQARGSSLQDQQEAIRREAKARGLDVERLYVEAESAVFEKIERREQIRALMSDVRAGDLVLCDKLDRWSRDPEFTYGSIRKILERGAHFYAVADACNPATQDGDTMLGVRVLVAREEHKRIRTRTVGTRQLLRDRGYYVEGLPPFGYKRQLPRGKRGPEKNILAAEPERAQIVREAFRRCVNGESIGDISVWVAKRIGRAHFDKSTVGNMLRNRVYLGEIRDTRGVWIKALHQGIVEPALFAKAQEALSHRRLGGAKPREDSRTATWLVRSVARCAKCGSRMSAVYGGGPHKKRPIVDRYRFYLRCIKRCGARYVSVGPVDIAVAHEMLKRLTTIRSELARGGKPAPKPVGEDWTAQRDRLRQKRARYLEAFADGAMDRDELRTALSRLDAERSKIDAKEADAARQSPLERPEVRRELLARAEELREAWGAARAPQRRRIVEILASAVRVERDKRPIMVWRSLEELAERSTI